MIIVSIEPTPNPNSMKLNLNESLPEGIRISFTKENLNKAPSHLQKLLEISGVKSVFQTADFISIERNAKSDWRPILTEIKKVFEHQIDEMSEEADSGNRMIESKAYLQKFRNIPMQIKLITGTSETRVALPERFVNAVQKAAALSSNYIMERKWDDLGVFYGDPKEIADRLAQEVASQYNDDQVNQLVNKVLQQVSGAITELDRTDNLYEIQNEPDAAKRLAALEKIEPTKEEASFFGKLLDDPNSSIRKLAAASLGTIGGNEALPFLYNALKDSSVAVRRAAGDAISDIGDPAAIQAMVKTLKDPSKIVRWRAARFLFEVGDESALPALREAINDPEFEVQMQVKMAIKRIESGESASSTVWQQMIQNVNFPRE